MTDFLAAEIFEIALLELSSVRGGFDAGRCFDDVWPVAATAAGAAALTGGGALAWGAMGALGAGAISTNCGDGQRSPARMLREGVSDFMSNNGSAGAWSGSSGTAGESIPTGVP